MIRAAAILAALLLAPAVIAAQTPPAFETPVGMVDRPCPAGAVGRSAAVQAYARLAVTPGPMDPKAMAPILAAKPELDRRDAWTRANDFADLCLYRDANAAVTGPVTAVFLGDSITELWQAADPDFFGHGVLNRGISGQTSNQVLLRFMQDVAALHPRVVHVMIGTNDVAGNNGPNRPEDWKNNIRAITVLAKANGIRVVLAALPPAGAFPWRPAVKPAPRIAELNAWLRTFAAREHVAFVDYGAVLAGPDGAMKPGLSRDGVHPYTTGYALMEPLARKAIAEALR